MGRRENFLLLFLNVLHQQCSHLVAVSSLRQTLLQKHGLGLSQAGECRGDTRKTETPFIV